MDEQKQQIAKMILARALVAFCKMEYKMSVALSDGMRESAERAVYNLEMAYAIKVGEKYGIDGDEMMAMAGTVFSYDPDTIYALTHDELPEMDGVVDVGHGLPKNSRTDAPVCGMG